MPRIRAILSLATRATLAATLILSMTAVAVPIASAAGTTYYVDVVNGDDMNSGTSEGAAWKTLTRALEGTGTVPAAGDTVRVLPGTYSEANGESFPIGFTSGVTLESRAGTATTVVDGQSTVGDSFFTLAGVGPNTTIRGFTFQGNRYYPCIDVEHDLATNVNGWPLIQENHFQDNDESCIFLESVAAGELGARVVDNVFARNGDKLGDFADDGSCIYTTDGANPLIEDNVFLGNYADDAAVYFYGDARGSVVSNTFDGNEAASNGAAIWVDNTMGEVSIRENTFVRNAADNNGGAVSASWSDDVIVSRNLFEDNVAGQDGGSIASENSSVFVLQNDIRSGRTGDDAGGIYVEGSEAFIHNNILYANQCEGTGGALSSVNSTTFFFNNTVFSNWSTASMGGFDGVFNDGVGVLTISNSILWGHSGEDATNTRIRYSCTEADDSALAGLGNTVGAGMVHAAPMFFDDDVRLRVGSPCIDAATEDDAPATDIVGTVRPVDGDGDGVAASDMGAWERPALEIGRVSGSDRYATAAQAAKAVGSESGWAVIASGQDFPDALSAAGLCGAYDAPLLLTATGSLPSVTKQTLADLGVTDVIIVGGKVAVSKAVEDTLAGDYDVVRIAGADRYETSALVADEVATVVGSDFPQMAFVARGDEFPDALAVSPHANDQSAPILLVQSTSLPSPTRAALTKLAIQDAYVCGGTGAVSDAVKTEIDGLIASNTGNPSYSADRWAGADRFETAVEIAQSASLAGFGSFDYVGVTTGLDFPDALAGGVRVGADSGVVMLTRPDSLPKVVADELTTRGPEVVYVDIFGGEKAVTPAVEDAVFDALGW